MTFARDGVNAIIAYHDRTKHHFHRYARSMGYLDWANQPDPFRRYTGARMYRLPFIERDVTPRYDDLFTRSVPAQPLTVETLGVFLEQSLGISATKAHGGSSWKLRCNPSSGNLHPTEGYVLVGPMAELGAAAGVYHYAPEEHAVELRAEIPAHAWEAMAGPFPRGTFFAGLTSIYWREAWKYGERAFRYCHHDVGHALGALRLSAASLGWRCVLLDALSDGDLDRLLGTATAAGLPECERERPDLLMAVVTDQPGVESINSLPGDVLDAFGGVDWIGEANRLSAEHVDWAVIDEAAEVCRKPTTVVGLRNPSAADGPVGVRLPECRLSAGRIFRQRRSAVSMDGSTSISAEAFGRMLRAVLPARGVPPFDAWPYPPLIDLVLFVHRVRGIPPGMYVLVRDPNREDALRGALRADFAWNAVELGEDSPPLFLLAELDCRGLAMRLSCLQEIAGDGAFSLGMIAEFERPLQERGAWFYPRLFWEAGLIGQVLYLEAEAMGVRSTGIGCYFDDAVHETLGLRGHGFQSLYHFTVGGAIDDARITGLPPYSVERRAERGWM